MKKRIPKPYLTFAHFKNFCAYAWRIDYKIPGDTLTVLGDTAKECIEEFLISFEAETGKSFN